MPRRAPGTRSSDELPGDETSSPACGRQRANRTARHQLSRGHTGRTTGVRLRRSDGTARHHMDSPTPLNGGLGPGGLTPLGVRVPPPARCDAVHSPQRGFERTELDGTHHRHIGCRRLWRLLHRTFVPPGVPMCSCRIFLRTSLAAGAGRRRRPRRWREDHGGPTWSSRWRPRWSDRNGASS
jgi:hypothetical protein